MITFDRTKGTIFNADGSVLATGIWAGHGWHANVITDEALHGLGPLPAGEYTVAAPRQSKTLGRFVMDLVQVSGKTFDRSLFRIHGDTVNDLNHAASDGCIIAGYDVRVQIDKVLGDDRRIKVT